ncbi:MAG: hypothetical protein KC583_03100, partial [Myxococcales bacterium]|nr:hypothetical protein [Myxococcales bacterium]
MSTPHSTSATPPPIDIGVPGQWSRDGLKALDDAVIALVRDHVTSRRGRRALRWYLLDSLTAHPVVPPFTDLAAVLQKTRPWFWEMYASRLREGRGQLSDRLTGQVIGYETEAPLRTKRWKSFREVVFERIGLRFGPPPDAALTRETTFDVGAPGAWRYDAIRAFDTHLSALAYHHAQSEIGAETIRWHVWDQLTRAPRAITLDEVQAQLEAAEASLVAQYNQELRRQQGHLDDDEIAMMLGFEGTRPVAEGYFRQLREDVYGRIACGFGALDLPDWSADANAYALGRQGAWDAEALNAFDAGLLALARRYARTEAGAQAVRWYYLDELTSDADIPADLRLIEQQLKTRATGPRELFGAFLKKRSDLGEARIARMLGLRDAAAVTSGAWHPLRDRVHERVGEGVLVG